MKVGKNSYLFIVHSSKSIKSKFIKFLFVLFPYCPSSIILPIVPTIQYNLIKLIIKGLLLSFSSGKLLA